MEFVKSALLAEGLSEEAASLRAQCGRVSTLRLLLRDPARIEIGGLVERFLSALPLYLPWQTS